MVVSIKDIYKMIGVSIVSFCAVIVCAMFLNYYLDLVGVESQIMSSGVTRIFYEAQCSTSKVVSALSGDNGCSDLLLHRTLY